MPSNVTSDQNLDRREAAVHYLSGRIDWERALTVPYRERHLKLGRMRELLARIGRPDEKLRIIHVAGTKGKGSTAAMIGAVLSASGLRTGIFSSPHLDRVEQRLAVDGEACPPGEFADLVESVRPAVAEMDRLIASGAADDEAGPTYFEITTALALLHFARRNVDFTILEVGLGGRLDSTNVCTPEVSVITSISFDHTKQLGETLESIAWEKAGIIKPGVPVVSGVTPAAPRKVIRAVSAQRGSRLVELGADFDFEYRPPRDLQRAPALGKIDFHYRVPGREQDYPDVGLSLAGRHQAANAAVALAAVGELGLGSATLPVEAVRAGLAAVSWPARVEVVARRPAIVVDTAHNRASIESLVETLGESFSVRRRLLVFATTLEKDVAGMLESLVRHFDDVIFTRYLNNPRGVPPEELARVAENLTGRRYEIGARPADAWAAVLSRVGPDDLICVTGSFYIAAEMRHLMESSLCR
jgi:dihydrofolate synthase/folylpolyglutamate synthase